MTKTEKRRFIRYDALHLLDYNVMARDGSKGIYSMGRTLDVSVDGIKMEIKDQLKPGTLLLVTVGLEDNLIELIGQHGITVNCVPPGRILVIGFTAGEIPTVVTHNDTKLNNVLLDDATGEGICVIDLDTVMPGLAVNDFGDAIPKIEDGPWPMFPSDLMSVLIVLATQTRGTTLFFAHLAERF